MTESSSETKSFFKKPHNSNEPSKKRQMLNSPPSKPQTRGGNWLNCKSNLFQFFSVCFPGCRERKPALIRSFTVLLHKYVALAQFIENRFFAIYTFIPFTNYLCNWTFHLGGKLLYETYKQLFLSSHLGRTGRDLLLMCNIID